MHDLRKASACLPNETALHLNIIFTYSEKSFCVRLSDTKDIQSGLGLSFLNSIRHAQREMPSAFIYIWYIGINICRKVNLAEDMHVLVKYSEVFCSPHPTTTTPAHVFV